jgi:TonB family protein
MPDTWKQWEGHTVNGKFPLIRHLGESEHSAVFLTELSMNEVPVRAAIKLVLVGPEDREVQLSRWRQAAELSHPHLISLYEMGRCELDSMPLLYVVMEYAEESLAQVLPARSLTPDEGRAMLESVLDVLTYLHGKGFVHGHVKPENILAASDQLKISSDGLLRAGEPPVRRGYRDPHDPPENAGGIIPVRQAMSAASDVWSLGITLVEALTQNPPTMRTEEQQDPLLPETMPEPFLDIARHCVLRHPQRRWTVAQIAARLEGRAPVSQAQATAPRAQTPAHASQSSARPPRLRAKRRNHVAAVAIGFALVVAAMLAGPRLLRHHSDAPQVPAPTGMPPLAPATPKQAVLPPQEPPEKEFKENVAEKEPSSKILAPVPTSVHPEMIDEKRSTVENVSVGDSAHGEVAQQVAPEVLQSARDSIRGTVRVIVRVNVDQLGNVEDAELESPGPSKYFARIALQAAKVWKFKPPKVGNKGVLSSWTLRFEFTRDGTNVVPTQEIP